LGGSARGGWLTFVPGAHEISVDALVGSALPEQLAALGYIVEKIGANERILLHSMKIAAVETFELRVR
jgi:hypothetical protein